MGRNPSFQNEIPPARVNIRLSVEGDSEQQKRELPLKLLVLGRFVPTENRLRVGERSKWQINKDNFDGVMASLRLKLHLRIDLPQSDDALAVPLQFQALTDFDPVSVARQMPSVGRLLAARNLVRDLGSHLLDNRVWRRELENILRDQGNRQKLCKELVECVQWEGGAA